MKQIISLTLQDFTVCPTVWPGTETIPEGVAVVEMGFPEVSKAFPDEGTALLGFTMVFPALGLTAAAETGFPEVPKASPDEGTALLGFSGAFTTLTAFPLPLTASE